MANQTSKSPKTLLLLDVSLDHGEMETDTKHVIRIYVTLDIWQIVVRRFLMKKKGGASQATIKDSETCITNFVHFGKFTQNFGISRNQCTDLCQFEGYGFLSSAQVSILWEWHWFPKHVPLPGAQKENQRMVSSEPIKVVKLSQSRSTRG